MIYKEEPESEIKISEIVFPSDSSFLKPLPQVKSTVSNSNSNQAVNKK